MERRICNICGKEINTPSDLCGLLKITVSGNRRIVSHLTESKRAGRLECCYETYFVHEKCFLPLEKQLKSNIPTTNIDNK